MIAQSGMSTRMLNHVSESPSASPAPGVRVLRGPSRRARRDGRSVERPVPARSGPAKRAVDIDLLLAHLAGVLLNLRHDAKGLAVLAVGEELLAGLGPAPEVLTDSKKLRRGRERVSRVVGTLDVAGHTLEDRTVPVLQERGLRLVGVQEVEPIGRDVWC